MENGEGINIENKNIIDIVPVMIWISASDKSFCFFNLGWINYTGRTLQQETGNGWIENIYPADLQGFINLYQSSYDTKKEFFIEYRLKRKDGVYRWISTKAVPMFSADKSFTGYAGVSTDIQDQKNISEQQESNLKEKNNELNYLNEQLLLRNVMLGHTEENTLTGIYSWIMETAALNYSDNLFRILGCQPGEFVPSLEKFLSFIHPDDREKVKSDSKKAFEAHELTQNIFRVITKNGDLKYLSGTSKFIGKGKNKIMLGSVIDITKETLFTEELTEKNRELERNNAELESFTYIASHDLQEPLRKIQSFSNLILNKEKANLSTTANDYFSRIISAVERMQRLIEDLLSYSGTHVSAISFSPFDLNTVMKEVQLNLHERIEEKNTVIEMVQLPTLNVIKFQMYQLFTNIIANALKFSKADVPLKIKIAAAIVPAQKIAAEGVIKQGNYWHISFSDNGIGFEQQYENRIFELFQRLHGKNEYVGTGICLAICKKIVHNHNGYITAIGKPGVGSVFNIYLPVSN